MVILPMAAIKLFADIRRRRESRRSQKSQQKDKKRSNRSESRMARLKVRRNYTKKVGTTIKDTIVGDGKTEGLAAKTKKGFDWIYGKTPIGMIKNFGDNLGKKGKIAIAIGSIVVVGIGLVVAAQVMGKTSSMGLM